MEAHKMKTMIKDVPTITGKVNLKALGVSSTNFPKISSIPNKNNCC